ncbi:MAG: ABC transporter permease [Cyclobacteriaceae bacterium]
MFKNYLITGWRTLRKNPFIHLLNISGLAIGVAAFLFISLSAWYEYSYDQFHEDVDQIYRVNHVMKQEGQDSYYAAATFPRVGPAVVEEFEQVENSCRLVHTFKGAIGVVENKPIKHQQAFYAEPSVFEIFSFPFIHGDRSSALSNIYSVVLSENAAMQHFGTTNCLGKQIDFHTLEGEHTYLVTGVFDNSNPSHMDVEVFLSFSSILQAWGPGADRNWRWFDFITYLKMKPGTDISEMEKQIIPFIDKHGGERLGSSKIDFDFVPVSDIHLASNINQEITVNGDGQMVTFLVLVGGFILVIAWINYINLYTARASDRSREVGIRKALGSTRGSLIKQFFTEAAITNFIAVVIGYLGFLMIKYFSFQYLGIALPSVSEFGLIVPVFLLAMWVGSILFSGTYPALFISRFRTLTALKGNSNQGSGLGFRKALVIFQFMASGFMIGGTVVVFSQFQFMKNQPMGVDTTNTVVMEVPNFIGNEQAYAQSVRVLRNELSRINGVTEVAISSDVPGAQVEWRGSSFLINKPNERKIVFKMTVGNEYLDFLKADFIAGRNFYDHSDSLSVIINEETMYLYGFTNPEDAINKQVRFSGLDTMRIVGVINNFYQESLREAFKPTVYLRIDNELRYMSVRVNSQDTRAFLEEAESKFNASFPSLPFAYSFMEDLLELRHEREGRFQWLFNAFSALAIFLSLLGLLGLAFYTTIKRRKEAGIRKVLGSSSGMIIQLVFKDFAKLVILGNLVMVPFLWLLSNQWLDQFAFHIQFSWLIPVLSLVVSLFVAFGFTFFHLNKLGKTNPAEVLKNE